MKRFFNPVWVILLLVTGCFDTNDKKIITQVLDENVGHRIPLETAERWIATLESKPGSARLVNSSISSIGLQTLLGNPASKVGIAFHHATDILGLYHLLVTPIDQDMILWDNYPIIDATTGLSVSQNTAINWAQRYNNNHPGEAWYHFFGMNVFNDITSNSLFNYFDIVPALNDEGEPQLILLAWNTLPLLGGRTSDNNEPVAYDDSNRCPPCQCHE